MIADNEVKAKRSCRVGAAGEIALIFLLFFVVAGTPPPHVNEAHYLAKAKHYWDPAWCPHDLFLGSADAHLVFYWTLGPLTRVLSLPAVAWVGRIVTWLLLAWSWQRLSDSVVPGRLVSVLTAAIFVLLTEWGSAAGEWVVGGVEAKGLAYVLTLFALTALVRGRWHTVWLSLGAASSFHVLVGGWSALAAMFAAACCPSGRPRWTAMLPSLLGGLVLALPGLVPALALSWNAAAETAVAANKIYVYDRLDHHLVFHRLPLRNGLCHVALLLAWIGSLRRASSAGVPRRLSAFVGGAVLIAVCGVILDQTTVYFRAVGSAVLRYYWFRLSDAMLPLGCSLAVTALALAHGRRNERADHACLAALVLAAAAGIGWMACGNWADGRPAAIAQSSPPYGMNRAERHEHFRAWQDVCRWIALHSPPDAIFLTPRYQQTFKWYAERGEVVSWKDIPQDAQAIVEWNRRIERIFPPAILRGGLVEHGEARLRELAREFGFRYIVLDRLHSQRPLAFPRVYPDTATNDPHYEVYRLPPGDVPEQSGREPQLGHP